MSDRGGFQISLTSATVTFPDRAVRALSEVNLQVSSGEAVAILGASGCGKTTLLRALVGAVRTEGSVGVGEYDAGDHRHQRAIRQQTGVLRQASDLVPQLSGRTNAIMGVTHNFGPREWLDVSRGRTPAPWRQRMALLAAEHRVSHCLDVPASRLSGGERHRVALLRALMGSPRMVLADEPTTGLDQVAASAVVDELLSIVDSTLIVTTHDLDVARRFPRKIGLRNGRVLFDVEVLEAEHIEVLYSSGVHR